MPAAGSPLHRMRSAVISRTGVAPLLSDTQASVAESRSRTPARDDERASAPRLVASTWLRTVWKNAAPG